MVKLCCYKTRNTNRCCYVSRILALCHTLLISLLSILSLLSLQKQVVQSAEEYTTTTTSTNTTTTITYHLVGVSGGLQDGFPERSKMDYVSLDPNNNNSNNKMNTVPAVFVGKGLVRGFKAYLDVMEPNYRQYVVRGNIFFYW